MSIRKIIKEGVIESTDFDWVKDAGKNKILTINKLKELFNEKNINVDWDIDYDRIEDGHGDYNEYFGKFYYDRENPISYNESYFIELYEKGNGQLFFYLYRYDEEDDKYYRDEVYSQIETSSKDPENFWRTVGWLVLYQMGKIKPGNGENTVNESDDMDWIKKQEPEKEFKKSKSYAVDVSHLRPDTPISMSPTSPKYTDLTIEDILDKLKAIGYNVDEIPVHDVGYLYVEPSDDAGYWNEDGDWVKQHYWVDYDTSDKEDPTYGDKYQMVNIEELMFLIDNKIISESDDFDWVRDEPLTMNTCEAYGVLKVGDEIIINEIDNWEDNPNQWDDERDLQTLQNVKAKVLALDMCSNIHKGNESDANTILVSIEEDGYYGFDESWSRDFVGTLPSQCQKDNCMFLICDTGYDEYQIQITEQSLNESNDLDWINSVGSYVLGDFFEEIDASVCFNEPSCFINFHDNKITFSISEDEWIDYMGRTQLDSFLLPFIRHGSGYIPFNYNYDDLDYEEFNYVGRFMDDEQKDRLTKIIETISQNTEFMINDYINNEELNLVRELLLKYDPLLKKWDALVEMVLHVMGIAVTKNRWSTLGQAYQEITNKNNLYLDSNGETIDITIPINTLTSSEDLNLSMVLYNVSSTITEIDWDDLYFDSWSTEGVDEDISWHFDDFLTEVEEIIEVTDWVEEFREFESLVLSLRFKHSRDGWVKGNTDGTSWRILMIKGGKVNLGLFEEGTINNPLRQTIIPFDYVSNYINKYSLNI